LAKTRRLHAIVYKTAQQPPNAAVPVYSLLTLYFGIFLKKISFQKKKAIFIIWWYSYSINQGRTTHLGRYCPHCTNILTFFFHQDNETHSKRLAFAPLLHPDAERSSCGVA